MSSPYPNTADTESTPIGAAAQAAVTGDTPPGAQDVAKRAQAWVKHGQAFLSAMQADLEKYVPAPVVTGVESEVVNLIKEIF